MAPQWSKQCQDKDGNDKYRVARADVVVTIPESDELQWLDVTSRSPTAAANAEGGARNGGFAALQGERERTTKYGNRNEVGPDTVKPISLELGGRAGTQTTAVLQAMTRKLAEANGEELTVATVLWRLRLILERTLNRAEADALSAASAYEEPMGVRRPYGRAERAARPVVKGFRQAGLAFSG